MWDAAANFASWRRHLERGVLAELQAAFQLAEFMGFTETEVQDLCQRFPVDFEEIRRWYDGYRLDNGLHLSLIHI